MIKKALFLDFANTIYPVVAIEDDLFELIYPNGELSGDFEELKAEIMRKPFQHVVAHFQRSGWLIEQSMNLLQDLTYQQAIAPFPDYTFSQKLHLEKFLITYGLTKLQFSNIGQLGLENNFRALNVLEQTKQMDTKKSILLDTWIKISINSGCYCGRR